MAIPSLANQIDPASSLDGPKTSSVKKPSIFCETKEVREIISRGRNCLSAGVPLHLCGPAGVGKTALAVKMAAELHQPMCLMTGHEGLSSKDFLGQEVGHSENVVVDRYIQSVRRKETRRRIDWQDAMLAEAMRKGHTLIYDEFTRSTPEANVLLLSVLEEGVLVSSGAGSSHSYIHAHPDFRIILTSNPSDYVAVNAAPDALLDRMLTMHLRGYGAETEAAILSATLGLERDIAVQIVAIVAALRAQHTDALLPSMRTSLLIGKIVSHASRSGDLTDTTLAAIVSDVVLGRAPDIGRHAISAIVRKSVDTMKKETPVATTKIQ